MPKFACSARRITRTGSAPRRKGVGVEVGERGLDILPDGCADRPIGEKMCRSLSVGRSDSDSC